MKEEKDKENAPEGAEENAPEGAEENAPEGAEENAPEGAETFKSALDEIKKGYEEKIAKLNADHEKELDERTQIIKQLLTGNPEADKFSETTETISEKINKKRNYEF